MKKRIISLILVVATLVLTLTGCAFNYAKRDLSKYATLNSADVKNALLNLSIKDGTFGTDPEKREEQVKDAVLKALLSADTTKKLTGSVGTNDQFAYCYFAVDADGNVFYSGNMDASKPTVFQLGLSGITGLNEKVAKKIVTISNIKDYIYSTKSANTVAAGDVVSVTYLVEWDKDDDDTVENEERESVTAQYQLIGVDEFSQKLIGAQVGIEIPEPFTAQVKDGETDVIKTFSNVKVENIFRPATGSTALNVMDEDEVFVTYTINFDATPYADDSEAGYTFPTVTLNGKEVDLNKLNWDVNSSKKYIAKVTLERVKADQYELQEGETEIPADKKTFANQIIGITAGSATGSKFTVDNGAKLSDDTYIKIEYTDVKVSYIVGDHSAKSVIDVNSTDYITVEYTPYTEALKEDKSNKKTELNVYGQEIELNEKALTYYIFPVYYVDVVDTTDALATAKFILKEFGGLVGTEEPQEEGHDHTEGHKHPHIFTVLDEDYKGAEDKTILALVEELAALYKTWTEKEDTANKALSSLKTAHDNFAKADASATNRSELEEKREKARTAYATAKVDSDLALAEVNKMVDKILACKKGEETVPAAKFFEGYTAYHKLVLELTYENDIKTKIESAVIAYYNSCGTFTGELPKSAVKQAYKALMNSYKASFYGNKTTFASYADFDAYLIATLKVADITAAKAALQAEAEKTVKDIIRIYILLDAVEEAWGVDLTLTKAEKKDIRKQHKQLEILYKQYGAAHEYDINTYYHAAQFDKIMNFLLTAKEDDSDLKVKFEHIDYTFSK